LARRTQVFQQLPWRGGLNSAVDSGVLPPDDLQQADNVVFTSSGARTKRQGFTYWDSASDIPAVTHRSSSGTTRTLVFASTLSDSDVDKLVAGEGITVSTTATSGNEFDYYRVTAGTVTALSTTNTSNDTITYTATGSLTEGSTATTTATVTRAYPIVRIHDYWRFTGSALAQLVIGITSQPKIFKYDSAGRRKEVAKDSGATARSGTATQVDSIVFNETLIVGQSRLDNKPIKYKPETDADWVDLGGTPPDFSIMAVHLNRVWTNDKANRDRLHYSATGDHEQWNGQEDSGALDIRPGDGDPVGITAIFTFKGRLFVAKKTKLYQIVGSSPEDFQVVDASAGLGVESHLATAAIDQDDVLYVSSKGAHSVATTASYSDFATTYLSAKIQPTFNELVLSRLPFTQAAYVPPINSVAFAVSESDANVADTLYLYNVQSKEWYRWPDISAQSLGVISLSSTPTLFIGTADGKLIRTQNGAYTDFSTTGIRYRIKSGTIYPDNSPVTVKAFKRVTLFYRPTGSYSITVRVKIDNYSEQALVFNQNVAGDLLGSTFILGTSILGSSGQFAPFTLPIDGYGRGFTIEVEQTGTAEQIAIYGFAVEYEMADVSQETTLTSDSN
jgi:hypothetical protein